MASPTCPFCNQPMRTGAKFCAKCGRALIAPPVPSSNAAGVTCSKCRATNRAGAKFCANCRAPLAAPSASQNVGVKCPQCGTLNRVGARFCAKCRSDLSARAPVVNVPRKRVDKERGFSLNTWRIFAALGAGALVLLCLVGALVAYNARGKPTAVAGNPSPAPTPEASAAPLPQATPSVKPTLPSASDPNFQVFTDKDFGYQITVPKSWSVTGLNGSNDGIPGSPDWSVLIADKQVETLQNMPPDTNFTIRIYRQVATTEADALLDITDLIVAQPEDVLRRESGQTIEYYTARKCLDYYDRPTLGRWFWDGSTLLSVIVVIRNETASDLALLQQSLDSVRWTNP